MLPNKLSEAPEVGRIKQLICKVGDDGADNFKKDILKVVEVISENYGQNKTELREAIVTSFIQCATLIPIKAGIYATIFALLSAKQATQLLTEQITQSLLDQLYNIAQESSPILGQTIMKFLSELMNVGMLNTVSFVECLYDLGSGAEQENSPFYLQILLTTLPHTMVKAMEKNQIEFKNIIQNVEVCMTKRKQTDRLFYLWQAIRNFLNTNNNHQEQQFMKTSFPRPYVLFTEELAQIKHIRKNFKIPIVKQRQSIWRPQQILVPFEKSDAKTEMQNEIIRQWIYETIDLFKLNRLQLMLQLEMYGKCMKLQPQQESQFKQILVYTLLNMVIDITPRKDQLSSVFFSGLISNLYERDKSKEWYELIDQFVDQVPMNNVLVIENLSDFLSHFIANTNFKINWDKLFGRVQMTDEFETGFLNNYLVLATLRKLFLLVDIQKVQDLVPSSVSSWLQSQPDAKKFQEVKESEISETINGWLQQKIPGSEIVEKLQTIDGHDKEYIITVFLECLMIQISKSITHLNVLGKRYLPFLLQPKLVTQKKCGELLLSVIYNMWSHSAFHLKSYLKEFISLEVISNLQLVSWLCNLQESKLKYSEFDESNKAINIIVAVNDVLKKQSYLEQSQEINYETTLQMVQSLQQYMKICKENLILTAFENILYWVLILLKQNNNTATEKIIKELNNSQLAPVVWQF